MDACFDPIPEDGDIPLHSRHTTLEFVSDNGRFKTYRSGPFFAFSRPPSSYPLQLSGDPDAPPEPFLRVVDLPENTIRVPIMEEADVSVGGAILTAQSYQGGRIVAPIPVTFPVDPDRFPSGVVEINRRVNICESELQFIKDDLTGTKYLSAADGKPRLTFDTYDEDAKQRVAGEFDGHAAPFKKTYSAALSAEIVFFKPANILPDSIFREYDVLIKTSSSASGSDTAFGSEHLSVRVGGARKVVLLKVHTVPATDTSMDDSTLRSILRRVNEIWAQASVEFRYVEIDGRVDINRIADRSMNVLSDGTMEDPAGGGLIPSNASLFRVQRDLFADFLNVFFVDRNDSIVGPKGLSLQLYDAFDLRYCGIPVGTLDANEPPQSLSHELVHVLTSITKHSDNAPAEPNASHRVLYSKLPRNGSMMIDREVSRARANPFAK